jgi:hypothetical protein
MGDPTDYITAYQTAKAELSDLIFRHREIEKRIVLVRQSLPALAALCESAGFEIQPSSVASYLLKYSSLADEIRAILKSVWPEPLRTHAIKIDLERFGHDLTKYANAQSTIQMVVKRMIESGEVQEINVGPKGKKAYRYVNPIYDEAIENPHRHTPDGRTGDEIEKPAAS